MMNSRVVSQEVPVEVRWLLAVAGSLLPSTLRSDWIREWYAEFWHSLGPARGFRRRMRARAFGSFPDAWVLLRQDYGLVRRIQDALLSRSAPVTLLALLMSAVALCSGGFSRGRNLLFDDDSSGLVLISQPIPFMGGSSRVPGAQVDAWFRRSESVAELGRWSIEDRVRDGRHVVVCRADAAALSLLAEAPVKPPCRLFELTSSKALPFAGVLARLKSGTPISKAEQELAQTAGLHKGWTQQRITRLEDLRTGPLKPVGFALFVVFLFSLLAVRATRITPWVWAVPKITLSFAVIAAVWAELVARAPFTETAGIPSSWSALLYLAPVVTACSAAWWLRRDARRRCRICYRALAMPVSVGMSGRYLFEPGCVEHLCCAGHGSLLVGPAIEPTGEESWVTWSDRWA
jgi:hypothetical protein